MPLEFSLNRFLDRGFNQANPYPKKRGVHKKHVRDYRQTWHSATFLKAEAHWFGETNFDAMDIWHHFGTAVVFDSDRTEHQCLSWVKQIGLVSIDDCCSKKTLLSVKRVTSDVNLIAHDFSCWKQWLFPLEKRYTNGFGKIQY